MWANIRTPAGFLLSRLALEDRYKLGHLSPEEQRLEFPNVWTIEETTGPKRLVLAPAIGHVQLMLHLTNEMPEPFWVLYVLTVSRVDCEPGRYQSDGPKTRREIEQFLIRFAEYFENDGRHHLWVGSEPGPELLVYDRHNKIYAYGAIDRFSRVLIGSGLTLSPSVPIPFPHTHHYHSTFDEEEKAIMNYWEWRQFPLHESDED
jgi:hypothetical protein